MVAVEKLDGKDLKIVSILMKNARSSLREIGREVSLSPSSVKNRISRLIEIGIIERFTVDVDHRKMGYEIQVVILITTRPGMSEPAYDALYECDAVTRVYMTAGTTNLVCFVRARNIEELARFIKHHIEKLDGVEKVETMFMIPPHVQPI